MSLIMVNLIQYTLAMDVENDATQENKRCNGFGIIFGSLKKYFSWIIRW